MHNIFPSIPGKTMDNLRNWISIKLATSEKQMRKYASKPSFERFRIFNEDLDGIQNKVTNLLLNKPVYDGCAILDLSKTVMYDFHYNVMTPRYGHNLHLLFNDTDSLMNEIFTEKMSLNLWEKHHRVNILGPFVHFLNLDRRSPGCSTWSLVIQSQDWYWLGRAFSWRWWHQLLVLLILCFLRLLLYLLRA